MLGRFSVMAVLCLACLMAGFESSCLAFAAGAEPGGQRDIFGFAADTGLWALVLFLILFFFMKKMAWGPMLEGLQKREENIRKAIDEADAARLKSQKLQGELDEKLRNAGDQIRQMIEEARKDGQELKDSMVTKAREEIATEKQRLQKEMQLGQDQAMKELLTKVSDLALLISTRVVKKSLSIDDHKALVSDCLRELDKYQREGEFLAGAR